MCVRFGVRLCVCARTCVHSDLASDLLSDHDPRIVEGLIRSKTVASCILMLPHVPQQTPTLDRGFAAVDMSSERLVADVLQSASKPGGAMAAGVRANMPTFLSHGGGAALHAFARMAIKSAFSVRLLSITEHVILVECFAQYPNCRL